MFFTDKMPENCRNCPCADGEYGVCNIDYSIALSADDRPKECPLQEIKHGVWIDTEAYTNHHGHIYECSNCHAEVADDFIVKHTYCLHCGAKMNGGKNE